MNYRSFSALLATLTMATSAFAADIATIGVVNFATCITDSKSGKREQENMDKIRKQISSLIDDTEKELKELSAKFEDTEFVDSLSPKAEEEMKLKYQTLQEDMSRYQNQYYQVIQHAQYQLVQKMSANIAKASESVAKSNKLDYVINKEACFYIRSDLDVTTAVITEMDKLFDAEPKTQAVSDNSEEELDLNAIDENQTAS